MDLREVITVEEQVKGDGQDDDVLVAGTRTPGL
jgi:hypothetical protein